MAAGYPSAKAGKVNLTEEAIDGILEKMQDSVMKIDELQGKMVKLRNAEVELLKQFEAARDYMNEMVKIPDRELLSKIFGGDCKRIAIIRQCLESAKFSDMYEGDARRADCMNSCETVEAVLNDLGFGDALRKALEEQKNALKSKRMSKGIKPEELEALQAGAMEVPVMEAPVIEEPPAPEPEPPAPEPEPPAPEPEPVKPEKKDLASQALSNTMTESLIEQILACTSAGELSSLAEPDKAESLGNWMIWMVHRAHLNDPTLIKFDFTNLQMPPPSEEPRISPKLAKAIASNTFIAQLLLPNTNLSAVDGGVLAESVAANSTLKVLNIDSNFLGQMEMDSLANASGTNQSLEELRVNNQHGLMMGRSSFEAFSNAVKANKFICKLGLSITDPHYRNEIDRSIMRNNDDARKRRVEAKKAAEAAAA